jgi:hypothetical protein
MDRCQVVETGWFRWALWGDVPAIMDSIWRRAEFYMYRPGRFVFDPSKSAGTQLDYQRFHPANSLLFALYALLTVFLIVGPTVNTFCGLGGPKGLAAVQIIVGLIAFGVACLTVVRLRHSLGGRLRWRLGAQVADLASEPKAAVPSETNAANPARKWTALLVLLGVGACAVAPPIILIVGLVTRSSVTEHCRGEPQWVWPSVWQLVLIVLIPLFAAYVLRQYRAYPSKQEGDPMPGNVPKATLRSCQWLAGMWVLGILALLPWAVQSDAKEAMPGPYLQTAWIAIGLLVLIALYARRLANSRIDAWSTSGTSRTLAEALRCAELLDVLEDAGPPPRGRVWGAFVVGFGMRPLLALLLPAAFALTVPRAWLWWFVIPGLAYSTLIATYGALRPRWQQVVQGIQRWFLVGLPLPVSIVMIVLAILRLANEQYVATVLEAAPIGTIASILAVGYLAAWFFEVWINRWIGEAILRKLGAKDEDIARGYKLCEGIKRENGQWTVSKHFALYIHGPGRIGVQGWQEFVGAKDRKLLREERFSHYTFMELFTALLPEKLDGPYLQELQRQLRVYYYSLNVLVAMAAGLMFVAHGWASTPQRIHPVIAAAAPTSTGVDLSAKLVGSAEPALIVAASGGGTRAALYAAYALQGLNELGLGKNIVLLSGASGGGAAVAAFADRFNKLTVARASPVNDTEWGNLRHDLSAPFISDVLDGVNELRIASGVSMGELLVESMDRRLYLGQHHFGDLATDPSSGDAASRPALILNSTISGHPASYSAMLNDRAAWRDASGPCAADTPFGWLAGERLVYTNLGARSFELSERAALPDVNFRFTVINDPNVELAQAAALNANFPPVFPNAKVTIARSPVQGADPSPCPLMASAYFVTDGGATENLSLVSALVALRNALLTLSAEQWAMLRPLHVVAIEASAVDYEYSEDRGLGAATGGSKERLAGGVTQLLLDAIDTTLTQHGRPAVALHFLPLPLAFRSRGGFGTHWMYAQEIRITNPLPVKIPRWYEKWRGCGEGGCRVTLDQDEMAALWGGLFAPQGGFCAQPLMTDQHAAPDDARTVQRWVCGGKLASDSAGDGRASRLPDYQVEEWERMVQAAGSATNANAPAK